MTFRPHAHRENVQLTARLPKSQDTRQADQLLNLLFEFDTRLSPATVT